MTILINIFMFAKFELSPFTVGLVGSIGIFLIGLCDDKFNIRPITKIIGQSVIITGLFFHGIKIEYIALPIISDPIFFNQTWSFIFTMIWLLVIINMFNIIDGIDGLSTGVSFLTAIVLFFVSLSVSPPLISFLLCIIIGATGMFLKFNFYPAKIFLGDSGALLLGYLFGIISILGVLKSTVSILVFAFIFAIPLMDICLSIVRRLFKRKNIFNPDLEHIHHQLTRRGLSVPKATLILYFISAFFGIIGVVSAINGNAIKLIGGIILFVLVWLYFSILQMSKKRFKKEF
ncbi:MAG: MraY family glycosyltransferase [Candidatus Marinamargulisbacteria bacterium]